jgi:hypothetical protein
MRLGWPDGRGIGFMMMAATPCLAPVVLPYRPYVGIENYAISAIFELLFATQALRLAGYIRF